VGIINHLYTHCHIISRLIRGLNPKISLQIIYLFEEKKNACKLQNVYDTHILTIFNHSLWPLLKFYNY